MNANTDGCQLNQLLKGKERKEKKAKELIL